MTEANGILARVKNVERAVDNFGHIPERIAVVESKTEGMREDLKELQGEVRGLKRAVWAAAITFGTAVMGWLTTLLQLVGH